METIEDIIREMRGAIGVDASDWFTGKQVRDWAERIHNANRSGFLTLGLHCKDLTMENERLRAELAKAAGEEAK